MRIALMIVLTVLIAGCGGGSSSIVGVDNSKNTTTQNAYGYIGDGVILGKYNVNTHWTIYYTNPTQSDIFNMKPDGSAILSQSGSIHTEMHDYGVSKDGKEIRSTAGTVKITKVKEDYLRVTKNGVVTLYDCYDVLVDASTSAIMCPD